MISEVSSLTSDFSNPGEVKLTWEVSNTTNLLEFLFEYKYEEGTWKKSSYRPPATSRSLTYKLVAGNWKFRIWSIDKNGAREATGKVGSRHLFPSSKTFPSKTTFPG